MFRVKKLTVGQLQTNCYLVISEDEVLIIDPGDDADYIQRILKDEEVKPAKIIATHAHYDHILAAEELKQAFDIPFLMHKEDEFLLERMATSAEHFSKIKSGPPPEIDEYLKNGDLLKIGNCKLKIISTPGHTPGSVSLYNKEKKLVFAGDLIFAGGGIGRTDFSYADSSKLRQSINKIRKLPSKTVIYSGHGEESIVGDIIKFKSF